MKQSALKNTAILAQAALLAFCATAQASTTLPPRKPGFWQTSMTMAMTMTMNGKTFSNPAGAPTLTAMCSSAATDAAEMQRMSGGMRHCSAFDIEQSGSDYTMTGSCADPMAPNGGTISFHGTITPEGDEAFHMVSTSSGPNMSAQMVGDSKWLGPCPAGTVPGDFGSYTNGQFVKHGNMLGAPAGQ